MQEKFMSMLPRLAIYQVISINSPLYLIRVKIVLLIGTSHAGHTGPWIGISDVVTDGEFVYESDGKAVTMDHFMSGAPSGGAGSFL